MGTMFTRVLFWLGPGDTPKFHDPLLGSAPIGRGPPLKRHQNIHVNMAEEREYVVYVCHLIILFNAISDT